MGSADERRLGIGALLRRDRRRLAPALLAVFITYAYFVGPPAWNQNSRFALTRALVESQTTAIDPYHHTTGDKSRREGHFYSDKAPGASFLAVPIYAVTYGVTRLLGREAPLAEVVPITQPLAGGVETPDVPETTTRTGSPDTHGLAPDPANVDDPLARSIPGDDERLRYNQAYRLALYLSRLLTTSLLALAGVLALYLLALRRLAGDRSTALTLALIYGLATPAFVYSTALYGHQLAADFLLIALAAIVYARRPWHYLSAGTCLGWAVICEYTAAVPVVLILALTLALAGRRGALWTALGGLPWAVLLGVYHWAAFGSPLKTGYDFVYLEHFAEGMAVRYGIAAPDPQVLYELLFSSYRGLFYLAPVMLLAAWGLVSDVLQRARPRHDRAIATLCALICVYFLLLNAGYYMWDGGAAFGPRHCVPMLPFLCLGLAPALRVAPRLTLLLALISAAQMTLGAASAPEAPQFGNPIWDHAWPRLRDATAGSYTGASNLGLLLGLPGWLSLLPLLALWLGIGRDLRMSELDPAEASAGERARE